MFEVGTRVIVEDYFADYLIGEAGTVVGYSPLNTFHLVVIDRAAYFQLKEPKWLRKEQLRKVDDNE